MKFILILLSVWIFRHRLHATMALHSNFFSSLNLDLTHCVKSVMNLSAF